MTTPNERHHHAGDGDAGGSAPLDAAAQDLRAALHARGDEISVTPLPSTVDAIRDRSVRRRRATIGLLSCVMAVVVLGAGVSFALVGRSRASEDSLYANQPDNATGTTQRRVTTTVPDDVVVPDPGTTTPDTTSPPNTDTTVSPTDRTTTTCSPFTGDPACGAPTTPTAVAPTVTVMTTQPHVTDTTVPSTATTSTTVPGGNTTTTGVNGTDCGSANQYTGYPTTPVMMPSSCLIVNFDQGTPAFFHLTMADPPYPNRILKDFQVTGVKTVRVRVDRTQATNDPHDIVTYECHELLKDYQQYYVYNLCTVVG